MKSVIITGANRGIGLDTTLSFARAGYKVYATMRNPEKADTLHEKIENESLNVIMMAMDVNSDESVTSWQRVCFISLMILWFACFSILIYLSYHEFWERCDNTQRQRKSH